MICRSLLLGGSAWSYESEAALAISSIRKAGPDHRSNIPTIKDIPVLLDVILDPEQVHIVLVREQENLYRKEAAGHEPTDVRGTSAKAPSASQRGSERRNQVSIG
jgi:hypothetical protein